jgi:hypothetical protein
MSIEVLSVVGGDIQGEALCFAEQRNAGWERGEGLADESRFALLNVEIDPEQLLNTD